MIFIGTHGADDYSGSDRFVFGMRGDDMLSTTAPHAFLFGMRGADYLDGGSGRDFLNGGRGNDWLHGDDGNDVLTGGRGRDVFEFDFGALSGVDRITDFKHGIDTIQIDPLVYFPGFFGNFVTYDRDSGSLYFDMDGTRSNHDPVKIAILESHPRLTEADFIL